MVAARRLLNQRPASAQLACGATLSMRTVAVRVASALPALFVEEYVTVCVPSPLTATLVPCWAAPPSSVQAVSATPDAASDGLSVSVTARRCASRRGRCRPSAAPRCRCAPSAVRVGSATSPLAHERYVSVWAPSPEWSDGAATSTLVPVCVAPPSSSQVVRTAPAPGTRVTVTGWLTHADGASSLLAPGGVVAIVSVEEVLTASSLPALSVE